MERDDTFLRPEEESNCEISRLDFKIMYPLETEESLIPFGDFNTKQALHRVTKKNLDFLH